MNEYWFKGRATFVVGGGSDSTRLLGLDARSIAWRWFSICVWRSMICCSMRSMCSAKSWVVIVCYPPCPYGTEVMPMHWGVATLGCTARIWPMVGIRAGTKVPNDDAELKGTVAGMSRGGVVVPGVVLVLE